MEPILSTILARRSIRKFSAEPVVEEMVQSLLEAAMAAPSASNRRPWEFVVVDDTEALAALRVRLPLGRYNAPLAIVVCGNLRRALLPPVQSFWIQDCSAAAENILLAAKGMGLGSVWIGIHPVGPLVAGVRKVLGLPKHVVPLGLLWIGHPAEEKPPRTQFDAARVHRNRWRERQ